MSVFDELVDVLTGRAFRYADATPEEQRATLKMIDESPKEVQQKVYERYSKSERRNGSHGAAVRFAWGRGVGRRRTAEEKELGL